MSHVPRMTAFKKAVAWEQPATIDVLSLHCAEHTPAMDMCRQEPYTAMATRAIAAGKPDALALRAASWCPTNS
eukprot:6743668-Alexandrium_andersonii.AAC.1